MGEQGEQEWTEHAPLRGPCVEVSMADVLLPTLTNWERPVRMSNMQLQREVFSSRVVSLVISLEGTVLLHAEL